MMAGAKKMIIADLESQSEYFEICSDFLFNMCIIGLTSANLTIACYLSNAMGNI